MPKWHPSPRASISRPAMTEREPPIELIGNRPTTGRSRSERAPHRSRQRRSANCRRIIVPATCFVCARTSTTSTSLSQTSEAPAEPLGEVCNDTLWQHSHAQNHQLVDSRGIIEVHDEVHLGVLTLPTFCPLLCSGLVQWDSGGVLACRARHD